MTRTLVTTVALSLLALFGVAGCGSEGRIYDNNDLELATSYTAKEVCSCFFVMEQSEEYCRAWTKASPDVADFSIDTEAKRVSSTALLFWSASAKFTGPEFGCVLE